MYGMLVQRRLTDARLFYIVIIVQLGELTKTRSCSGELRFQTIFNRRDRRISKYVPASQKRVEAE